MIDDLIIDGRALCELMAGFMLNLVVTDKEAETFGGDRLLQSQMNAISMP